MAEKPAKRPPRTRVKSTTRSLAVPTPKPTTKSPRKKPAQSKAASQKSVKISDEIVKRVLKKAALPPTSSPQKRVVTKRPVRATVPLLNAAVATEESVVLPNEVPEHLHQKYDAVAEWYAERFPRVVAKVAFGSGIGFVAFAMFFLVSYVIVEYPTWKDFQAAALCATVACHTETATSTSENTRLEPQAAAVAIPSPSIRIITKPDSPLTAPTAVSVHTEYVRDLELAIESLTTGMRYRLTRNGEVVGSDHTFLLDPAKYDLGEYEVRARGVAEHDGKVVLVTGSRFSIAPKPAEMLGVATSSMETQTASTSGDNTPTATTTPASPTEVISETLPVVNPAEATALSLHLEPGALPSLRRVVLRAHEATTAQLFVQRLQSTQEQYIGLLRRIDSTTWHYALDTASIPSGSYVVFARVKVPAGTVTTERVALTVDNALPMPTGGSTPAELVPVTLPQTTQALDTATATAATLDRTRYLSTLEEERTSESSERLESISAVLASNERVLNELFKRYASAVQSADTTLEALATSELEHTRRQLVESLIQEGKSDRTAGELGDSLEEEFSRIKQRIEVFEGLRKSRNQEVLGADSDGDGISDYDETTLYGTNPEATDSDGDAVPDGIEIMRGFDPRDPIAEAVLAYASPKEFGLIRNDVLAVTEVVPVIETDTTRGQPSVQAEIRGRALPNTIVTLFIFSTPTIVTVKTDADGNFTHHFDRELEDGTHEVYVAITDNAGDIIAKSVAYAFVKQGEVFTIEKTAVAEDITISPHTTEYTQLLANVVVAMGVLVLGLVLLLCALAMRRESALRSKTTAHTGTI